MAKPKLKIVEQATEVAELDESAKRAATLQAAIEGLQAITIVYLPDGQILRLLTAVNGQQMTQLRALKVALSNVALTVDNAIDQLFRSIEEAAKAAQGESRATES